MSQFLHEDDCPATLRLLDALLGDRADALRIGYRPDDNGAIVDWDRLLESYLSSTEKATVHFARGACLVERHGGFPPRVAPVIRIVMAQL